MSHLSLSHPGLAPSRLHDALFTYSLTGKPGSPSLKDFTMIGWLNERDLSGSNDCFLYFLIGESKAQRACWSPRPQGSKAPGVPSSTHSISWVPSSPGSRAPQSPTTISWAPSPHPEQAGLWRSTSLTYICLWTTGEHVKMPCSFGLASESTFIICRWCWSAGARTTLQPARQWKEEGKPGGSLALKLFPDR